MPSSEEVKEFMLKLEPIGDSRLEYNKEFPYKCLRNREWKRMPIVYVRQPDLKNAMKEFNVEWNYNDVITEIKKLDWDILISRAKGEEYVPVIFMCSRDYGIFKYNNSDNIFYGWNLRKRL